MPMLQIRDVETQYGEIQIIKGITLSVKEGELVAMFGPNGHGKSTLLKAICGLLKPTAGTIEFLGKDICKMPTHEIVECGLVYVPEDRHLFPEMTVVENLKLGAYIKSARTKYDENIEFVMNLFPKLKVLAKRVAGTLSGGEARMLTIGRGLMSNAKMLCIDEPSLGLAPNLREDVFKAIDEIKKSGFSVLLVEQSTTAAADLADHVYLLEDGRIVFHGTREEARNNEKFMETFLGIA
jgi:branched-chain amino acid transport system ATP-binding protein